MICNFVLKQTKFLQHAEATLDGESDSKSNASNIENDDEEEQEARTEGWLYHNANKFTSTLIT